MPAAIAPILETVRRVRSGLAAEGFPDCALIGFAGAPFTVACYMVEGGSSRDFPGTRTMAFARPALFDRLIGLLTDATVEYLSAQIDAGAEAIDDLLLRPRLIATVAELTTCPARQPGPSA